MKINSIEYYGIIYKITNKVNSKVYIGQTTLDRGFNDRYSHNGVGIERVYNYHKSLKKYNNSHNKHLLGAIEKYGFNNFEVIEVFDTATSKFELDMKEIHWIAYYDSFNNGYNQTEGGAGVFGLSGENHPFYGKHHTEETKNNISKKLSGRKFTEEHKQKISEANKGKNCGKNHTEEWKEKMSKRNNGGDNPNAQAIICVTTGKIFDCIRDGANYYNCNYGKIGACCRGERKSCGKLEDGTKLVWRYLEDYLKEVA